jgi:hypothetical protein
LKAGASVASQHTVDATSSAVQKRWLMVAAFKRNFLSSGMFFIISVSTGPGATELAITPLAPAELILILRLRPQIGPHHPMMYAVFLH